VHTAIFNGDAANSLVAPSLRKNNLNGLLLNLYQYDDTLSGKGTVVLATELLKLEKQLKKEETYVSEARLHNIEKLKEKQKETQDKYLRAFDYIKMVDGIYFGWLLTLANIAVNEDERGRPKIITTAADILSDILKKIYLQIHNKIEPEAHQLIEAISIYFIRMYYYGESSTYALNLLKKAFNEEVIDSIQKAKVNKIDSFNDITKLLRGTELLAITENTFDLQMKKMFGKMAYEEYISPALVPFLAFMANLAHPNQLFKDAYPIDEKAHERLEELLLNEQKQLILQEKEF
jgi:hypothetical protein